MKSFIKKDEILEKLGKGYTIYTESYKYLNSYQSFTYYMCNENDEFYGHVHHQTIIALQNRNIIDNKYNLKTSNK